VCGPRPVRPAARTMLPQLTGRRPRLGEATGNRPPERRPDRSTVPDRPQVRRSPSRVHVEAGGFDPVVKRHVAAGWLGALLVGPNLELAARGVP
jgi:hypothetical protein